MKKILNVIWMAVLPFILTSCQSIKDIKEDERAQLRAIQITYSSTMRQLIVLRKAGKISDSDTKNIKTISKAVSVNLTLWNTAIQEGLSDSAKFSKLVNSNLELLTTILNKYNKEK